MYNHLHLTRQLYNAALEQRRIAWKKCSKTLSAHDQARSLPDLKIALPEYQGVYAQVLQSTLRQLDKAYQSFFRRARSGRRGGPPRFKSAKRWNSFLYPQVTQGGKWHGPGKLLGGGKVYLPKVGNVRIKQHRPLEGLPKALAIKTVNGKWYAIYMCEVKQNPLPPTGRSVGLDLGLTSFVATSGGQIIEAPKYLRQSERAIKQAQRIMARRKRGSNRRQKAARRLARRHEKVRNQRKDFHHKLARKLVNENDLIAHENLSVARLIKSRFGKSISDAGWASFLAILVAKAEEAGRRVVGVSPNHTSQTCPECGNIKPKTLSERVHRCECGYVADRDVAAARVILARGLDGAVGERRLVAAPQ